MIRFAAGTSALLSVVLTACAGGEEASATAADCFNPILHQAGTTTEIEDLSGFGEIYRHSSLVKGFSSYRGNNNDTETEEMDADSSFRTFELVDFSIPQVTLHGASFSSNYDDSNDTEAVYRPGVVTRFDLSPGDSYGQTYERQMYDSQDGLPVEINVQTTYVGQELVAVPAGTFTACRFEYESNRDGIEGSYFTTIWLAVGNGLVVKTAFDDQVFTLKSAKINGMPVTGN